MIIAPNKLKCRLDSADGSNTTSVATVSVAPNIELKIGNFQELVITLDIISAVHTDETYDFYITMSDGVSIWDIAHFPQVATTGAKRFTARILSERQAEVTTATPGVAAEPSAILATITTGSGEGKRTLAAGKVRNGPFADYIGYDCVIAGSAPSIVYAITLTGNHI